MRVNKAAIGVSDKTARPEKIHSFSGLAPVIALMLFVSACARGQEFVDEYSDVKPAPASFTICYGYGCASQSQVNMSPVGWQQVKDAYGPAPANAVEERAAIARAIALIEKKVGAATGTDIDKAGASLFAENRFQLDCIDETANTTTYLRMLERDNLLQFHTIGQAAWRGQFINGWPHNTAVIVEKGSGSSYVVDSWFYANGIAPEILPLAKWKAGWSPPNVPSLI